MTKEEAKELCNSQTPVAVTCNGVAEKVRIVGVSNTSEEALVVFPFHIDDEEIQIEWVSLKYII